MLVLQCDQCPLSSAVGAGRRGKRSVSSLWRYLDGSYSRRGGLFSSPSASPESAIFNRSSLGQARDDLDARDQSRPAKVWTTYEMEP